MVPVNLEPPRETEDPHVMRGPPKCWRVREPEFGTPRVPVAGEKCSGVSNEV
jgi:hypothetical protein